MQFIAIRKMQLICKRYRSRKILMKLNINFSFIRPYDESKIHLKSHHMIENFWYSIYISIWKCLILTKLSLSKSNITCKKTLHYGVSFCVHEFNFHFSCSILLFTMVYTNCENSCHDKRRGQLVWNKSL